MGRKAVICECVSNGVFLVDDALAMGLEPVVVYPPIPKGEDTFAGQLRAAASKVIGDRAEILRPRDMDDLVSMLDGMDIACVVVGSEYGIPYFDMLCERLGIPGNDPSTTADRTTKLGMHSALERAGLRHIRSVRISSEEDIRAFWHSRPAVIKPSASVGTIGVHVCGTLDECIEAWKTDSATEEWTGGSIADILIQDFIGGREFIVNTISRDGVDRITDMWAYWKQEVGSGVAYDCAMSVSDPGPVEQAVADYALKVLDAVGVRNGPAHMELKSDDDGPVLIEINARPMGGHFSQDSLEDVVGHHITDLALRSALEPGFVSSLPEGIPPMGEMALKVLIVHEDRYVDTAPLRSVLRGVEGFRRLHCDIPPGVPTLVRRTEDLVSSPGSVEIVHRDGTSVMDDFAMLSVMEKSMPDLLYGFSGERPEPVPASDIEPGPHTVVLDDSGLTVPESPEDMVINVSDMPLDRFYDLMYEGISRLPVGGTIGIEPCTYGVVPYGRKGFNALMMLAGLEFEISGDSGEMVATKVRGNADQ